MISSRCFKAFAFKKLSFTNFSQQTYFPPYNSIIYKSYRSFHYETTKTVNFDQVYNESISNQTFKGNLGINNQDSSDNGGGNSSGQDFGGNMAQSPINETSFIMMLKMEDEKDQIESDLNKILPKYILRTFLRKNYRKMIYYGMRFLTFFIDMYKEYILILWLYLFL